MTEAGWIYLAFTGALAAAMVAIVIHYFNRGRRDRIEAPKYRMLEDDAER